MTRSGLSFIQRPTDRIWAPWHPEEEEVCRFPGDAKVMAWVALVEVRVFELCLMVDEVGRKVSVTGERYLNMWNNKV